MRQIKLNNGVTIPELGLGVFRTPTGEITENSVKWALEAGYRHLDTAMVYRNEESVGNAMKASGIPREEIFLTTKLWNTDIRAQKTREAFALSLQKLQTDYVDMYLIHWPVDHRDLAWAEMEKLYAEGKIRAIGVSNFQIHHLEELEKTWNIIPAVNQIEINPYFQNDELVDYCKAKGIAVESWSPLGGSLQTSMRDDPEIMKLAAKYGKTPTQIIIRWHLQRDLIVLPKSTHQNYIAENIDVFDFTLSEEDMQLIKSLEKGIRTGADPDNFDF